MLSLAAQHRQLDRHLHLRGAGDAQHANRALGAGGVRLAAEPGAAGVRRRLPRQLAPATAHGPQALDQMINYQAQVIAYDNDYWLMAIMSAPILLLLMLMRKPKQGHGGAGAVMD